MKSSSAKFLSFKLDLLDLRISLPMLNTRSTAADEGNAQLYLLKKVEDKIYLQF